MTLTKSPRGGLLEGQAPPRVRHAPSVRANAWEDVADLSARFGIVLDEWQENVLQAAMGERVDGTWAARQVGISTPRQNGKSQLIVARALAGVLLFEEQTIIISAHQQDTAREVFGRMLDLIESYPSLESRVTSVMKAINRESITFSSGQSIRFKARSTGGGRGFSCDCLLLDEAQILSPAAWSAILPTMSARPNPQAWLLGTPPTENDDGEVFGRLRQAGIDGKESRLAWLEWSASPGDPFDDPETWAKANPAYGSRISYDAVSTELASMSQAQFEMERLGMWATDSHQALVSASVWKSLTTPGPPDGTAPASLGVAAHDGQFSVIGCWADDEDRHVEEVFAHLRLDLVADWVAAAARRRIPVLVPNYGAAAPLLPMLQAKRVNVKSASSGDVGRGCELLVEGVAAGWLTHADQSQLADSVAGARKKLGRDGAAWTFDLKTSTQNAPAMGIALALAGAAKTRPRRQVGAGGRRATVS